jgi:hypothetical protein
MFYRTYLYGIYMSTYSGQGTCRDNRIYNNTFWYCGWSPTHDLTKNNWTPPIADYWDNYYTHAILFNTENDDRKDNHFKNNIFWQNRCLYGTTKPIITYGTNAAPTLQVLAGNWNEVSDPKFVNISGTPDPMNKTQFDFSLQSDSPCIGQGVSLTLANGSGSDSTTLVVDDAFYFHDGSWGSSLSDVKADWIAIGTVGNVVEIASVNYDTKTIMLASPMTWADNAPIWLYKNSSGERVLYGTAPEIGAKPYVV